MAVQAHDVLVARKSADQHHQRALGQVEVGDQAVHHLEFKTWRDENLRVAAGLAKFSPRFQRAHRRRAHCDHPTATRLARGNGLLCGLRHFVPFAVHGVFSDVFGFDGLEGASAHMQSHAGGLHALRCQGVQYAFVKVQRGGGRCHRARGTRKHRLVALHVLFRIAVGDVGRQRHMAVLFHQGVRLVAQLQVKQLAVVVGPAAQQHGIKPTVAGTTCQEHLAAHQWLFAHLHVRHHLVAGQHTLDQQFEFAARCLLAKDARLHHLGVVEHQQVACVQQAG